MSGKSKKPKKKDDEPRTVGEAAKRSVTQGLSRGTALTIFFAKLVICVVVVYAITFSVCSLIPYICIFIGHIMGTSYESEPLDILCTVALPSFFVVGVLGWIVTRIAKALWMRLVVRSFSEVVRAFKG